jgi:hypothetical protein
MTSTLNPSHPLLNVPFDGDTDFTVLADYCHQLAEAQAEYLDPALRMALSGRLSAVFALLKPQLNEPIPPAQQARFTVDTLPTAFPRFAPDSDTLGEYCAALTQLLLCRMLSSQQEEQLRWLLADLMAYLTAEINAPRWIRTADGVKFIDEITA